MRDKCRGRESGIRTQALVLSVERPRNLPIIEINYKHNCEGVRKSPVTECNLMQYNLPFLYRS